MPDLSNLVPFHSGQVRDFYLLVKGFKLGPDNREKGYINSI